jgi:hypothetical protein
VGVACFDSKVTFSVEQLLGRADESLYEQKRRVRTGANGIVEGQVPSSRTASPVGTVSANEPISESPAD